MCIRDSSLVGDLSAILIQNVNPLINFIRVPSKKIALMSEWETKIEDVYKRQAQHQSSSLDINNTQ